MTTMEFMLDSWATRYPDELAAVIARVVARHNLRLEARHVVNVKYEAADGETRGFAYGYEPGDVHA